MPTVEHLRKPEVQGAIVAAVKENRTPAQLEREAQKWFRPAKGQFQIYYRDGADHREYQPDFVAETDATIYMLEPKMRKEMQDSVVLAKKEVAVAWCANAAAHALSHARCALPIQDRPAPSADRNPIQSIAKPSLGVG